MKRYLSTIFSKGIIFITSAILFYATICFPENLFAQNCSLSASADQTICENQPLVLVGQKSGTFYGDGSTTWSQIEGPLVVITSPNSLSTSVTGFSGGNTYTFRLSGKCQDGSLVYDDVKIIVMPYDIATASYIQGKCNTGTFRITGNQPTIGTGLWSIIGDANGATILNPTNPTTSVVGLAIGKSVVLQWKINNGTCPESTSEITLTNWAPPAANAGPDQSNCNNDSFVMNANAVPDYAEGKWSIEGASNGASIDYTDFHNAKAHVSGLEPGKSVTLRWTITAGGCTSNSDDVVLKNDAPPTSADAGPDQMNCGNGTFLLAANAPIIGKGEWSIISEANGATISSIYTPNALVTNLKTGCSVTLRWTIRNGSCDSSSDDVVLTNFGSVTGTDQSNCNNGTFILSANSPTPGSGLWTIVGSAHGAQISNPTSPNATVNGVAAGNRVTLRWTVTNGACSQSSDVVLTNYGMPETITAGPNQTNCNNGTFIMAASSAGLAIGTWSIKGSANGAVITELHNPATTVTGLNPGSSVILTWTVANGTCTPQSSDVMLTNYAIPTQANAGPDQINCNSGTFILAGNTPAAGIGKWSFAGSDYGAIIADPTNPNTSVTGVPAGEAITLRWTIANGTCTSFSDEVMLTNKAEAPVANAGINQTQSNSGTFVMNANNSSPGVGTWTIQGSANGATIADIHNPVTTVSGLNPDCQAVLRWTIDNAPCPSTYSEVTLKNDALPTIANAGPDLSNCNNGSFTLGGNTPTVGKGLWTIIGINYGVTIADPSNPVSSVTGLQSGKSVLLRWTISNGISPASYDEVELTNYAPPSNAIAGANQTNCNNGSFTMAANTPASGEGTWSISGPANGTVITDIHNPTTTITGLQSGNSVTLVWTISNGVCSSNSASVVLTNLNELPIANAGSDQTNCQSGSFTLNANSVSSPATGTWTFVGAANGAKISNVNDPKATVSGLTEGSSTTLRWTLTNDVCSSTSDDIVLTNMAAATVANAGHNQTKSNDGSFIMAANTPLIGTGTWTIQGPVNGASIADIHDPATVITGITAGSSVTFRWTISNGQCSSTFSDVVLKNEALPSLAIAGDDQYNCNSGSFTLAATSPSSGTGQWNIQGDVHGAVIADVNDSKTKVTGLKEGYSVTLRWTVKNMLNDTNTDDVILTNYAPPTVANAGENQTNCDNGNFVMNANTPVSGIGTWSIEGASNGTSISNINDPKTTISGLTAGSNVTLKWTISNGICSASTSEVVLTNLAPLPLADAGSDQTNCSNGSFTLNATSAITPATGTWTIQGTANGASIADIHNPKATVTGLAEGSNVTLRWTLSNGNCTSTTDEVILTNTASAPIANAGSNQAKSNDGTFIMAANDALPAVGTWTIESSANGASIAEIHNPKTVVTGLTPGNSVTLRWTITNGLCGSTYSDVVLRNDALPSPAVAGVNQFNCNSDVFVLAATSPTIGTGQWSLIGEPNGASISDPTSPTSTVTGLQTGKNVTLRWTVTNGTAQNTSDVVLTNYAPPTIASAGPDQSNCDSGTFTMSANTPIVGKGNWSIQGEAYGATITNVSSPTTTVTGLSQGNSVTLRWIVSNGTCTSSTSDVVLTNLIPLPLANAGADQSNCSSGDFTLNANAVNSPVKGTWSIEGDAQGTTISNVNDPQATISGLAEGASVTLRWTLSNGSCTPLSDDVVLTNDTPPTTSNAGVNQNNCDSGTFTMSANTPVVGQGHWSIQGDAHGASITNNSSPTTTVTGLTQGNSVTLRWTISNGTCTSSTSDIVLTNLAPLPLANAGADQNNCSSGNFTLNANAVNSPVKGTWSIQGDANGAIISDVNDPKASVSGLTEGSSVTLRWTLTNEVCTPNSDDVVLTNVASAPVANAGSDQTKTNSGTFDMAANAAAPGVGTWTIQGAVNGASIADIHNPTTQVTGLTSGSTATLRWTISNSSCGITYSDVQLKNEALPSASVAGTDQANCNSGTFVMAANIPSIGTGQWSIIGTANGAMLTDPSSPTSTVTGLQTGKNVTLRWTVTNGSVQNTSDVVLTNYAPPTTASAGSDQTNCDSGTFTMSANTPVEGQGSWSIEGDAHGTSIANISSPTTTVTGLTPGSSVTLRWTISNGTCTSSTSDVVLTNLAQIPIADAGPDQSNCNDGTFTLNANAVSPPVTGTWSIQGDANGATISNVNDPKATISGLGEGTSITLKWTLTNGICTPVSDAVVLTNYSEPTGAIAGENQTNCNSGTFVMNANAPVSGRGTWSIQGNANGAIISDMNDPKATVSGLTTGNNVTLRWTISNGTCTSSTSDIILTNLAPLPLANAGADQSKCGDGNFILNANAVSAPVKGTWSIIAPENGAVISDVNDPKATVSGLAEGTTVTLRWTLSNGACTPTDDDVILTNYASPTVANAGTDQTNCNNGTFTMAANIPVVGQGIWSILGDAHGAVISDLNDPKATVSGLTTSNSVTLRWTISNGVCNASTSDIKLTNLTPLPLADAGADQNNCSNGTFTLNAVSAIAPAIGTWSIQGDINGAIISNVNDPKAMVSGLAEGTSVTLKWTLTNGNCTPTSDNVVLTNYSTPTVANAGPDQTNCNNGTFTTTANAPGTGEGNWTIVGEANGVLITDVSNPVTTVSGLATGKSVTLRWSISNGTCSSNTDDVILTNLMPPPLADAGENQMNCENGTFTLKATAVNSPFTGTWSVVGNANGTSITNVNDPATTITGLKAGESVTLRWTLSNGVCTSQSDDIVLTNYLAPTIADAGKDMINCNNESFNMDANIPSSGTGTWTIDGSANGAEIANIHDPKTIVTNVLHGSTVKLVWTISNGVCTSSSDDVLLTNYDLPSLANAGTDQEKYNDGNFVLDAQKPSVGAGIWSIIGPANGATIAEMNNPKTAVNGLAHKTNVQLRWTVSNGPCNSNYADVILKNLNDLPLTKNDTLHVDQDGTLNYNIGKNDTPSRDNGNIWGKSSDPQHGTLTVNSNGNIIYTPTAKYYGNDSFSYSLTDADGDVSNATAFIHVVKANDVPKPATHQLSTYEGVPLNGNLSLDDISSTDGGNVWILVANAQHGKAEVQSDGNFTYTPQTQYVGADSFTYTITDSNGDAATGIVSITIKACSLEISSVTQSIPTCFGTGNGTLNVNITGGETPIRYSIDGGMNYSNTNQFNSLSAGNYTILVSDGVGCKVQKDVFLSEPTKIGLDVTIDTMCCGQDANVILMATGGTGNLQYSTDNLTFESINKFKLKPGSYMISVKDQLGCSIEKQIVVPTTTGLEFYNLLTPNGDGRNDVWRIRGIERCRDNEVVIVNRWGEEVRRFRQYNNKTVVWDGTNKNNQKLPDGTYYYIVEIYGIQKKYTGWILLQGNR